MALCNCDTLVAPVTVHSPALPDAETVIPPSVSPVVLIRTPDKALSFVLAIKILPSAVATASESAILNVTLVKATPSLEAVSAVVSSEPDKSPLISTTGSSETADKATVPRLFTTST